MELNMPGNSASGYGTGQPVLPQSKPMSLQGGSANLQQNAQYNKPYAINNGNPGGANNMPSTSGQYNPYYAGPPRPQRQGGFEGEYANVNEARWAARQQRGQGMNRPPMPQGFDNRMYQQNFGGDIERFVQDPQVNNQDISRLFQYLSRQQGVSPSGMRGLSPTGMFNQGYQPSPQGYWNQGQNPAWGRYRPPMMNYGGQSWMDQGGYNYNLPGAGGYFPTQDYWG